jgi:hypothetical protein
MPPEMPLEDEEVTTAPAAEETTPVTEEGDSNIFSEIADELEAEDEMIDVGLEEATGETEEAPPTEEAPSEEQVPEGKEPPLAAEVEGQPTEGTLAPTEEPPPVVEAAATPPEAQVTESEQPLVTPAEEPEPTKSYDALRAEALVTLEKDFAISEDDAQTLVTEPEKVLPRLAASIYMAAYENATKSIMAAMPKLISQTITHQSAAATATNDFYGKWDKLDRNNSKHADTVNRIGLVYRQVNPNASQEQFTAEVGAQALLALGIPFTEIIDAPPIETPRAFVPAAPAGAAPTPPPPKSLSAFESLAEEFIDEDS